MVGRNLLMTCALSVTFLIGITASGCGGRKIIVEQPVKVEDEAERKAEADARRKAEADARRKAEAERLAAEEAERKAEADARRKAEAEAQRKAELTLNAIHFDFDKSNLRSDAQQTLAKHATVLQKYPEVNVTIEGHCDERGTIEYNLALGERRAKSARDYLVRYNLAPKQFKIVSFGKERPVDPRHNEAAWAKNRRAEFVVQETVISGK